jgi:hypothetical protein
METLDLVTVLHPSHKGSEKHLWGQETKDLVFEQGRGQKISHLEFLTTRQQICRSCQLPAVILCSLKKHATRFSCCASMKPKCFLLMTALLISGCAPVTDQLYSKKNFTSQSFRADVSECNRRNPSFVAIQGHVADSHDRNSYIDDAMVRDCMKAKGYDIQLQSK